MKLEKHYRLDEASAVSGYKVSTLRKKIYRKELGYRRIGRVIAIPESELAKLLGDLHQPVA